MFSIAERRYEPAAFAMKLALKDIRLVLKAAEHSSTPMPFASVLKDSFLDGIAHGDGHKDWAALADTSARRAGRTTYKKLSTRPAQESCQCCIRNSFLKERHDHGSIDSMSDPKRLYSAA